MKCYHCGKVLEDAWLRKAGASMLGRASGEAKRRSPTKARKAARKRWDMAAKDAEIARLQKLLGKKTAA